MKYAVPTASVLLSWSSRTSTRFQHASILVYSYNIRHDLTDVQPVSPSVYQYLG